MIFLRTQQTNRDWWAKKDESFVKLKLGVPLALPVRGRDLRSRKTLVAPVAHDPNS